MNYKQLTEVERYQIYSFMKVGLSQKRIAQELGKHPSTISRECRRNKGLKGYRPAQAQKLCDARRAEAYKNVKVNDEIYGCIERLIRQDLSPAQAVSYLSRKRKVELHHETVYQLIYRDQAAGGELYKHLRIARKPYRKRYGSYDKRGRIPNRVSIEKRSGVVDRRNRLGDWEGDTVIGKGRRGALLTMVERKSLYTVIVRLKGKRSDLLADALIKRFRGVEVPLKTITFDNGLEFSDHERMSCELGADIYFAHPYSSWERGINENTNGLIRQYFPKDTDFTQVTEEQIRHAMDRLNNRPRETRGGRTPNEILLGQSMDLLAA